MAEQTIISTQENSTMNDTKATIIRFNVDQQCPIQNVTVYNDRAEVTRLVKHHFDDQGNFDLVFEGFSPFVDATSLHVSGGTGKACTITEVSYQTCTDDKTTETALKPLDQLENELDKITAKINAHKQEVERLKKQRAWLDGRALKLMNQDGQMTADDFNAIGQFMEFYHKTLTKLDDQTVNEEVEIKKLTEQQIQLNEKKGQHVGKNQSNQLKKRSEVTISVHIESNNIDVNLEIAYLISNCSWSASYDVRVNSQELSKQQTQLTYYGIIMNKSQENWPDTQFSLSTATPSLGGVPPKLMTLNVGYYRRPYNPPQYRYDACIEEEEADEKDGRMYLCEAGLSDSAPLSPKKRKGFASFRERSSLNSKSTDGKETSNAENVVNVLSTTAGASMSSTSFAIPRQATIDADGKPHKVTIGVLDLTSKFTYTVIPKLSLHAFLKASTLNTSDKQLLAGPASIFMDNNFITNSSIDNVCVGDTFDLPLGTDASIKVDYKPIKKVSDTQGLISKVHHENIRRETRLTNTKSTEIIVYVYEQVPLSSDEKIKVKLIAPDTRPKEQNPNCTVTMNDHNNLEWKCILQPKEEQRLPLEYTLEWPKDKRIEYKEQT